MLGQVFELCPNLEEFYWLEGNIFVDATAPPICSKHLLRLRVLALHESEFGFFEPQDNALVTSVMQLAPMLEKVFLQNVDFDAVGVRALEEAVRTRTALQRMRVVCIDRGCDL